MSDKKPVKLRQVVVNVIVCLGHPVRDGRDVEVHEYVGLFEVTCDFEERGRWNAGVGLVEPLFIPAAIREGNDVTPGTHLVEVQPDGILVSKD